MTLRARFVVAQRDVSVDLDVPSGATTALVGPNGSGKSTVLSVLAGLVRPDHGRAVLDDRVLFDDHFWMPAHKRRIALLAQQPLLFPRMTARQNVEFSLRARKARSNADEWLELVAAGDLAQRRPAQLSGGQAQRVAIARALAAEPDLLLLDEPLASLDTTVAAEIRHTLRRVLEQRTALLVTHEVLDAALLADHIVVMDHGRIVESGPAAVILRSPRTAFAAQLCGLNLVAGNSSAPDTILTEAGPVEGMGSLPVGVAAVAAFAPTAVAVHVTPPHGSARNVVAARVVSLAPQGQVVRLATTAFAADVTPASVAALGLRPGQQVYLAVKASEVQLYER